MKKINTLYFPLLIISFFCFAQCKKQHDNKPHVGFSITLYNKPLDTIRFYFQGKWKLEYGKGGICGSCIQYFNNSFYTFSSNRVLIITNSAIYTDTTITWIRDKGVYTGPDSTFIMNFYDKRGYPYNYVVDGIFNDSLQLHDNAYDPVYYHFSKSN